MDIHYPILVPLNKRNIFLLLDCLSLNVVLRFLSTMLGLPIWLDTIGTMCTGIILGPWAAVAVSLVTTAINCLIGDVSSIYYAIVQIAVGTLVGVFYPRCREYTKTYFYTILLLVFIAVFMSSPVNMLLNQGLTGLNMVDKIFYSLYDMGCEKWLCTVLTELCIELPDKAISLLIATNLVHWYADRVGAPDWAIVRD